MTLTLNGFLTDPTFTSWSDLSANHDVMSFDGADITTSYACLYLETTNWENYIDTTSFS